MYAVICSPQFFKVIEQTITLKNGEILVKAIGNDIDILVEFERINRVPIKHLIIDITAIEDHKKFLQLIKRYRIVNDKTQIIIIAPNYQPGDYILHSLVTMGIYDIITDIEKIMDHLLEVLDNPSTYKKAVKWVIDIDEKKEAPIDQTRKASDKESTVIITKEKIIGTVVIAIAGTMRRIGTTHTAIAIAQFLKNKNFKVAVIEFHKSECFNMIKNSYEDTEDKGNYFILNGIYFYPYNDLNILDILEQDYNYVVVDMGIYSECVLEEFRRANLKIIVSGVKEWELTDLELILRTGDNIGKNYYIFNFADKYTFNLVKSSMNQLKCFQIPYNPNPFSNSKECHSFLGSLLKDVLPQVKQVNSKASMLKQLFTLKKEGTKDET